MTAPNFAARVVVERKRLADDDPAGELEAVAPLPPAPIRIEAEERSLALQVDHIARIGERLPLRNGHVPGEDVELVGELRFYTPLELATLTLPDPDWLIRLGLLAIGAITEVDGKIKAAGKTTLILHMLRAVLDGSDFLGQPTRQARAIYVTEQSRQTFADALRRAGLDGRGDELRILFREDIGATTWADVVAATRQDGYDLVVFDTIGKLSAIREENSAGEWSVAMSPLQDLAAHGRAVIVARHDRKSGGDVGDSGRGSSQASGDVDIILALRRPEGHQPSNRRVIESLSRYPETPDKIVVELTPDGYVLLGTDEAVAAADAFEFVSAAIGREYRQTSSGLSVKALVELGREREPVVKRTSIQAALDRMMAAGEVRKSGRGVAGDPYVYSPAQENGAESAETRNIYGRQTLAVIDDDYPASASDVDPEPAA